MQLELKDQIIILDEAHNIEDICRNVASKTIREDELEQVIEECKNLKTAKDFNIQFTFENIFTYCTLLIKFLKMQTVSQIVSKLKNIYIIKVIKYVNNIF